MTLESGYAITSTLWSQIANRIRGNECYPYKICKTLFEESEGRILLDLSGYRIPEEKAAEMEASRHRAF